jgi:hypothetical protein
LGSIVIIETHIGFVPMKNSISIVLKWGTNNRFIRVVGEKSPVGQILVFHRDKKPKFLFY